MASLTKETMRLWHNWSVQQFLMIFFQHYKLVQLGYAIGHTQLAISNNTAFSKKGLLYIGEFGTIAPVTHIRQGFLGEQGKIVGQKIVVVNASSGTQSDLVSLKNPSASFRPVGLSFDSNGTSLYIADFS